MSFNDNVDIDTSVERGGRSGGGRRGPAAAGGGVLILIIAVVAALTGNTDFAREILSTGGTGQTQTDTSTDTGNTDFSHCKTGADADANVDCRVIATMNSLHAVWEKQAPTLGIQYSRPGLDIYSQMISTGCGQASSQVGPFYCPADAFVYIDTTFFNELSTNYGANTGPLAQEFVVAHEVGHHISHQIGSLTAAQQDPKGPESGAVRVELQADCFAGVWAHHASTTAATEGGVPFLEPLTEQDIKDGLSAAAAVGDDRIQEKVQGRVTPETFTHGTAEQRQNWFLQGYRTGDPRTCNTFQGDI